VKLIADGLPDTKAAFGLERQAIGRPVLKRRPGETRSLVQLSEKSLQESLAVQARQSSIRQGP
jgi:hypothetical protein